PAPGPGALRGGSARSRAARAARGPATARAGTLEGRVPPQLARHQLTRPEEVRRGRAAATPGLRRSEGPSAADPHRPAAPGRGSGAVGVALRGEGQTGGGGQVAGGPAAGPRRLAAGLVTSRARAASACPRGGRLRGLGTPESQIEAADLLPGPPLVVSRFGRRGSAFSGSRDSNSDPGAGTPFSPYL